MSARSPVFGRPKPGHLHVIETGSSMRTLSTACCHDQASAFSPDGRSLSLRCARPLCPGLDVQANGASDRGKFAGRRQGADGMRSPLMARLGRRRPATGRGANATHRKNIAGAAADSHQLVLRRRRPPRSLHVTGARRARQLRQHLQDARRGRLLAAGARRTSRSFLACGRRPRNRRRGDGHGFARPLQRGGRALARIVAAEHAASDGAGAQLIWDRTEGPRRTSRSTRQIARRWCRRARSHMMFKRIATGGRLGLPPGLGNRRCSPSCAGSA